MCRWVRPPVSPVTVHHQGCSWQARLGECAYLGEIKPHGAWGACLSPPQLGVYQAKVPLPGGKGWRLSCCGNRSSGIWVLQQQQQLRPHLPGPLVT